MPPSFVNIQWRTYILFGVFCACMFVHVLFMFPETAGKTLEEVEDLFTDPNGIRYVGTPAWKTHVNYRRVRDLERTGSVVDEEKLAQYAAHHEGNRNQSDVEEKHAGATTETTA